MGMHAEAMQSLATAKAQREKLQRQAETQEETIAVAKMSALESSVAPMTSVHIPDPTNKQETERLNADASDEEEVMGVTAAADNNPTF